MKLIKTISELKAFVAENDNISLVPTMGALHLGHGALIKEAVKQKGENGKVVVSVFVNPIQFGPNEDFNKYPRTLNDDAKFCEDLQVDVVFAPSASEMYGIDENHKDNFNLSNNYLTYVCPPYFLVDKLCGKSRTGHFDGVATVVMKLFNLTSAKKAYFGQKDAQQLFLIKKMVKDLNLNVDITSVPIVRDKNGLALSSRNKYLDENGYNKALTIHKMLDKVKELYNKGITNAKILFEEAILLNKDNAIDIEYFEFLDFNNLENVDTAKENTLVVIAARVDSIRLIDNLIL
ncbi:MAG: pantoate--beta-alanine ligase [Candidatus Gastranaerophilales bacterium]|nr:pantoate--beta-alanine ligase [Candidatus Gastranaerophilales bacterium]